MSVRGWLWMPQVWELEIEGVLFTEQISGTLTVACVLTLGKSWACKHWKFQNNYVVIFLHFGCIFFCIWVCHFEFVLSFFVIFLSFLCHFFVIFCHLFVILLSFYCHFGNGKMEKKNVKKWLPWQTFCYLVAAPNTRNKCKNSWIASRRWRRIGQGSLPWGIRFWACLDEELSPGSGCRAGSKTGWGGPGPGWNGPGGGAASGPRSRADLETPKTQLYQHASHFVHIFGIFFAFFLHLFCIFFAFFCIFFAFPRLGDIFFAFLFAFPRLGVIFWALFCISQTGSHFLHFFAFPRPGLPPSPLAWSLWENDKKMNNARK